MNPDVTNTTIQNTLDMIYNETGLEFSNDSIFTTLHFDLVYSDVGILEKFHIDITMGIETTGGEMMSFMNSFDVAFIEPPVVVDDDTDDAADDDEGGFFSKIPGFNTGLLILSLLGVTAVLILSKRK